MKDESDPCANREGASHDVSFDSRGLFSLHTYHSLDGVRLLTQKYELHAHVARAPQHAHTSYAHLRVAFVLFALAARIGLLFPVATSYNR